MKKKGYLDLLKFDPKLRSGFIARYVTNVRIIALVVIAIIGFGVFGFTSLSRRVNPEVKIPIVFVSTILPGGSPTDMESLVTIPLEDVIESISGVEKVESGSSDNISTISVEFDSSIEPEKARTDVQAAVDTVTDLPEDATDPNVIALDFEDVPVWQFAVTTDSDLASLFRFADILKDRVESHPLVNKAIVSGLETQEIQVLIKPEAIEEYGINPFTLSQAVKSQVNSYPAGSIGSNGTTFTLTIDPVLESIEDVRNIRVDLENRTFRLGEIATVVERSQPTQATSFIADTNTEGKRIVTFSVFKLQSADIDKTAAEVHAVVDEVTAEFDNRFEVVSILDAGKDIANEFDELFSNLKTTILLVFFTLFFFLGIRQATIASFSIPLSFLIAFGSIQVLGLSLNFLTMFSLLLALGLVVDDAIVIISAMTTYFRTGKFSATESGLLVWRDFITPIWTTTITTIWAFVPLLLSSGIIGEFIKSIPIVVTSVLLASTSVAVLITLPLMMVIVSPNVPKRVITFFKIMAGIIAVIAMWSIFADNPLRPLIIPMFFAVFTVGFGLRKGLFSAFKKAEVVQSIYKKIIKPRRNMVIFCIDCIKHAILKGIVNPKPLSEKYERVIYKIITRQDLRRKVIFIVVVFFIFSIMLLPTGLVKNEFFPKTDADIMYVSLELPVGTNLKTTEAETRTILSDLRAVESTDFVIADIGRGVQIDSTATETNSHIASFTLILKDDREKSSVLIAEDLRKSVKEYDKGKLRVIELSGGPPAGSDIQIKLLGDDLGILNEYADRVITYMEEQPGLDNVEKSIKPGTGKLTFVPDLDKVQEAGLTIDQVGGWLRIFASGFTLDEVRFDGNDTQDITFRMNSEQQTPEELGSISIPTQNGTVPLLSLGSMELRSKPTRITREDRKRTISVSAAAKAGFNIPEISKELEGYAEGDLELPAGYEWATGGVNEENNESVLSIIQGMILAFILILGTMVVQLGSFRKSLIVLLVIPLAISGVFVLFGLTGIPLSFPALIGVLALFGIVVNNSIVVVDKINLNLRMGLPFAQSIANGASSRLEPIMFSSLTTIIGLLPITLTNELWRGLGGAIIAGLTFSGTVMLLFIPVMYYVLFSSENSNPQDSK